MGIINNWYPHIGDESNFRTMCLYVPLQNRLVFVFLHLFYFFHDSLLLYQYHSLWFTTITITFMTLKHIFKSTFPYNKKELLLE